MTDINTVSLSGVLTEDAKPYKGSSVPVTGFYIDIEGAGEKQSSASFKIVAFGELATVAEELEKGDRVVVVGALTESRGRGGREVEIRVRNLIPLPNDTEEEDDDDDDEPKFEVKDIDDVSEDKEGSDASD